MLRPYGIRVRQCWSGRKARSRCEIESDGPRSVSMLLCGTVHECQEIYGDRLLSCCDGYCDGVRRGCVRPTIERGRFATTGEGGGADPRGIELRAGGGDGPGRVGQDNGWPDCG